MNKEEIKEILELYKNEDIEYYNLVSDLGYDKLLNYIIKLQYYYNDNVNDYEKLIIKYSNLQEENKKLKYHIEKDNNVSLAKYNKLKNEKEQLELTLSVLKDNRLIIKKAIEYIKEYCIDDEFYINLTNKEKHIIDVLNILKGEE